MEIRKWKGDEAKKAVANEAKNRLERAAITLKNGLKEDISMTPPPSNPGDPPHKDTGRLRGSISHEISADGKTAVVGTNVLYGKFLELGTKRMAARPWLRPGFYKRWSVLKAIIKGDN